MQNRAELRAAMRTRRQGLSPTLQQHAAESIAAQLSTDPIFLNSTKIAAFCAQAGELDPALIMQKAWQLDKSIYLPRLQDSKQLSFVRHTAEAELKANRYNILEPATADAENIPAAALDLVLVPLLAFDDGGNRLGMGGGYYDSTFAFLNQQPRPQKPYLLGLAYSWQRCPTTFPEAWDVQLDAVLTEETLLLFSK